MDWNDQKYAEIWRHSWEVVTNRYLEATGRPERVDLRSFERQGIQQIPTVHLGPAAHQMEKRGIETFLGNLNRDIRTANSLMQSIRSTIRGLQRWIADLTEKKQILLDALEQAKEPTLSNLLVDYFNLRNEQRSEWSSKAQIKCTARDLNEVMQAVDYLKAQSLNTVEDLNQAIDSLSQTAAPLRKQLKQNENRMRAIAQIKDAAAVHAKLKPVHDTFIKKNFKLTKDAYAAQHKDELDAFNKAVRTLMKLNGSTAVDFSALDAEFSALQSSSAELRTQLDTLQPDVSALKNIRKYIDMVLNKQQLSAPGGKTPEKESVLKKLEEAKAAQFQKKTEQKKSHTGALRRKQHDLHPSPDRQSQCGGSGKISPGTGRNAGAQRKRYRWKAHDSLTVCGNKWFRHSQSKGGLPVDFVMEFYGKSFPEAVQMLTGEPGEVQPEADSAPSPAFRLPLRNVTNANILNYLTQERKLSPSLVNFFIAAGDIYEDAAHHNVVFVGRDADGHPRYASSRGIREKFRKDAAGAEKAFGFAHRGTDKQLLVFEAPIDLLSFIELFPKNWQQHNYLSLGGVSGKALRQFLSERPDVERVFLCLDADKAGEDACKRLAALLPDTVSVTRIQPCMKDWNEVLVHQAEIPNRNYFKSIVLKEPSKPETVKIIRMSDVELTPVEWFWKPYLPFGKLSVLQGNPGEGKTYFAMHLAAACTNGKLLPNMERMEPFNVIYQTAEDGLGDTVKPRLIEAGADLDRVLVIDDSEVQLTLSDERIEKAIIENNARLVIIDPIQAYLGADVDMNRANEVRPIFMRLGQVAQRTGCAILLIGHLNKAAGMQSLQRGLGSIDIAAAVRSVMFIGKLKHDPTMRILTHEKSSLAPPGASLAFSLGDEGGFRWVGEYDITADEMLSGIEPQRETKTQQAKDLICTLLAGGKQVLSEDIDKAALERGIPGRTVRDAKRELGDALKSKIVEGRKKIFWME